MKYGEDANRFVEIMDAEDDFAIDCLNCVPHFHLFFVLVGKSTTKIKNK